MTMSKRDVSEKIPTAIVTASQNLKSVSHFLRLQIFLRILDLQEGVSQAVLAKEFGVSQPSISHHMRILQASGFLDMTENKVTPLGKAFGDTINRLMDKAE
jgi:predicted transcriptional regulator